MCKGEAPIKARCLVFFTSLLHICYGYTLVTRSSNCRESGGCTGDVCVCISRHTELLCGLRTTHRTRHTPYAAAVRLRPFPAEVVPTRQVTAFPGN